MKENKNQRDYDVMMDNIGCYSPLEHKDDLGTNEKSSKNLNDNNKIQTQVLSPPNSEPVSSCTVINSSNNSSSNSHSINENEEDDKTEVNETVDTKTDNHKLKISNTSSTEIKKENIENNKDTSTVETKNKERLNEKIQSNNEKENESKSFESKEELNTNPKEEEKDDITMPPEHIKICTSIIRNIKRHHDSGPFLKPVDPVALGVPDYFTIIHHPMDISTIESKLKSSTYKNIDEFIDDFTLMFKNCYEYNGTQQPVSLMAKNLEILFNNQLNHYYHEVNNSSEESSQREILKSDTESKISSNSTTDSSKNTNKTTGGKTTNTTSRRKTYNNSFYSYLYKKSSSRLMKLSGEMVVCKDVINEILKKRYEHISYPFLHPVDPVALNIPDYPLIIKTPMDISTIQEKLDSGIYLKKKEFEDDFRLIFKNCYQYNPEGTDVYILGKQLEEIFNEHWNYYNDRYEKSLQPPEPINKTNTSNKTTHNRNSSTSHTNTPSHTTSHHTSTSRRNSHSTTTSHTTALPNNSTKMEVAIPQEDSKIGNHSSKKSHDFKSQTQQPLPIPNHAHATTPKTSSKSKKRPLTTSTTTKATKGSKTVTPLTHTKSVQKPAKRDAKKRGAGKAVKKRKIMTTTGKEEEEEKVIETLNDYEKIEESDNDERLKLEIEELQKTLQTCTARLSMLLEQKSESLNKKLPPTKKSNISHTYSATSHPTISNTTKNKRKSSTTLSSLPKKSSRNQKGQRTSTTKSKRGGTRHYIKNEEEEEEEEGTLLGYEEEEEEEIDEIEEEEEAESPVFYESYITPTKLSKKKGKKRKAPNPSTTTSTTKSSRKNSKKGVKRSNSKNETDHIPKTSVSFSIPSLNMDQKREISDCINKLPPEKMCEVVQIIQESIPLETGQEEIELDIESFDNATLWKLYQFVRDDQKKMKREMKKERSNIRKRSKYKYKQIDK